MSSGQLEAEIIKSRLQVLLKGCIKKRVDACEEEGNKNKSSGGFKEQVALQRIKSSSEASLQLEMLPRAKMIYVNISCHNSATKKH